MLVMKAICPTCTQPTASAGMSCSSCIGGAHRPKARGRSRGLDRVALHAPADMTDDEVMAAVHATADGNAPARSRRAIAPPAEPAITEPPVYQSVAPPAAPVGFKDDGQCDSAAPLKPRPELLPPGPLLEVCRVLAYGAKKYTRNGQDGADNWALVANGRSRYLGAALRHIFARLRGEILDNESGLPHLAHAATCVLFSMGHEEREAAQ